MQRNSLHAGAPRGGFREERVRPLSTIKTASLWFQPHRPSPVHSAFSCNLDALTLRDPLSNALGPKIDQINYKRAVVFGTLAIITISHFPVTPVNIKVVWPCRTPC